jgi:hypothetical protein
MPNQNKRIYYAVQNVALGGNINGDPNPTVNEAGGLQSVGINTTFALDPTYQLGQLASYYLTEGVPEVEVTLSKLIDGRCPVYLQACGGVGGGAANKSLAELQNARSTLQLSIFSDTNTAATALATVKCTGMYVSSISYNLTNDGNFTEELTLVGNHKEWSGTAVTTTTGIAPVAQRWAFNKDASTIPASVSQNGNAVLNSASASVSLGRESIFVLGQRTPYHRYATFPVEVTSEFQVLAQNSDGVGANMIDSGCSAGATSNVSNETISLVVCPLPAGSGDATPVGGTRKSVTIDLGSQNKLTSVNYSGGDTGGGNATITYSYRNYNDFKINWA